LSNRIFCGGGGRGGGKRRRGGGKGEERRRLKLRGEIPEHSYLCITPWRVKWDYVLGDTAWH
jgi:hypothetical protein